MAIDARECAPGGDLRLRPLAVTPNPLAEARYPGDYDASDPAKVAYEQRMKKRLLQLSAGDKYCPWQL